RRRLRVAYRFVEQRQTPLRVRKIRSDFLALFQFPQRAIVLPLVERTKIYREMPGDLHLLRFRQLRQSLECRDARTRVHCVGRLGRYFGIASQQAGSFSETAFQLSAICPIEEGGGTCRQRALEQRHLTAKGTAEGLCCRSLRRGMARSIRAGGVSGIESSQFRDAHFRGCDARGKFVHEQVEAGEKPKVIALEDGRRLSRHGYRAPLLKHGFVLPLE